MPKTRTIGFRVSNQQHQLALSIASERGFKSHHEFARSHFVKYLDGINDNVCVPSLMQQIHYDIQLNQRMLIEAIVTLLADDISPEHKVDLVLQKLSQVA